MKRINNCLIATLMICLMIAPVQMQSKKADMESLYLKALSASLDAGLNSDKKISTVEKDTLLLDSFPNEIGGHRVEYLNGKELVGRYKRERKPIWLTAIKPIRNEGGKLFINISNYEFSYEKNRMTYALDGGCKVIFRHDCSNNTFEVEKVECGGV